MDNEKVPLNIVAVMNQDSHDAPNVAVIEDIKYDEGEVGKDGNR